jgi:hypothetical protein
VRRSHVLHERDSLRIGEAAGVARFPDRLLDTLCSRLLNCNCLILRTDLGQEKRTMLSDGRLGWRSQLSIDRLGVRVLRIH